MKLSSPVKTKIGRLSQIADDLRAGRSFPVTRLTTLKSLCADCAACQAFALHMAKLAGRKMDARDKPDHIDPSRWIAFRQTVEKAIMDLEAALEQGIGESTELNHAMILRSSTVSLGIVAYRSPHGILNCRDSAAVAA